MYEYYKNADKELVFSYYIRIVDDIKPYEKLTVKKIIEEVLKQYSYENFLYYLCTSKELKFLKKILNNEIEEDDYLKYSFEIKTLNNKFIFDADDFCIFKEQLDNVKKAVSLFEKKGAFSDHYIAAVGVLRLLGVLSLDVFKKLNYSGDDTLSKKEIDESFKAYISNPLFRYYSFIYENEDKEMYICYEPYYDFIDELIENRKNYENIEAIQVSNDILEELFYYGFPIHIKKVKKMYDFINEYIPYLMEYVDEARVLGDYSVVERFLSDDKAKDIIIDGLNLSPSCLLYGLSPKEYNEGISKRKTLNSKMSNDLQDNAHLSKEDADEFFDVYFALLEYTNNKHNINDLKKIYKKLHLDQAKVLEISDYLFDHANIIDNFIKENPYDFDDEMLSVTKDFKKYVKSNFLMIVGFDKDYTKILAEDGKLYMVKGLRSNIDEVVSRDLIPTLISTTLIMFKGTIVYCGLLKSADMKYDNMIIEAILQEANKAITYYHL